MIFVDSSVWIDYFNGKKTPQTDWLDGSLGNTLLNYMKTEISSRWSSSWD